MRIERWAGIVGAVVFGVGSFLVIQTPGGGDTTAAEVEKFYVTDNRTAMVVLGVVILTLGSIGLLWFLSALRSAVGSPAADLGFGSEAVGLAMVVAGAAIIAGPSAVQTFGEGKFVGAPVAQALAQAGLTLMLLGGALFLGFGVAATSVAARRASALPPWVTIAGVVAGALQVVAFIWLPSLAIPLWVLLAGVTVRQPMAR
jgi:hypothetical protein